MPELKFETPPDHVVWYQDLSELVVEVYNRPFDFAANEEAGQGTYYEFTIEPLDTDEQVNDVVSEIAEWVDQWQGDITDWRDRLDAEREQPVDTEVLLHDLAFRGHIPFGRYLIKVWW